jgi:hypothetical protein
MRQRRVALSAAPSEKVLRIPVAVHKSEDRLGWKSYEALCSISASDGPYRGRDTENGRLIYFLKLPRNEEHRNRGRPLLASDTL